MAPLFRERDPQVPCCGPTDLFLRSLINLCDPSIFTFAGRVYLCFHGFWSRFGIVVEFLPPAAIGTLLQVRHTKTVDIAQQYKNKVRFECRNSSTSSEIALVTSANKSSFSAVMLRSGPVPVPMRAVVALGNDRLNDGVEDCPVALDRSLSLSLRPFPHHIVSSPLRSVAQSEGW